LQARRPVRKDAYPSDSDKPESEGRQRW
jgi:hypothetical protein